MKIVLCLTCLFVCEFVGLLGFHFLWISDVKDDIAARNGITLAEVNEQFDSGKRSLHFKSPTYSEFLKQGAIAGLTSGVALSLMLLLLDKRRTKGEQVVSS